MTILNVHICVSTYKSQVTKCTRPAVEPTKTPRQPQASKEPGSKEQSPVIGMYWTQQYSTVQFMEESGTETLC
jgi:hypothetical protein